IGTAPVGTGPAPGYYSGNTRLRVAFKGTGTNPVTYYACKERFNNGSSRNCSVIGPGSYTIATMGDARVLTLNNTPVQMAPLSHAKVFVERGGLVYSGYQNKAIINKRASLDLMGLNALFSQLGLPAVDATTDTPVVLSAGSYQGTWNFHDPSINGDLGINVFINANGSSSCQDAATLQSEACSLSFTNLASGAFTFTNGPAVASGSLSFLLGTGNGTYNDPTTVPATGNFVAARR
ncbi:MAG: hypothetical protein WCH44_18555, partial [Betaproteobacteria bacterium]